MMKILYVGEKIYEKVNITPINLDNIQIGQSLHWLVFPTVNKWYNYMVENFNKNTIYVEFEGTFWVLTDSQMKRIINLNHDNSHLSTSADIWEITINTTFEKIKKDIESITDFNINRFPDYLQKTSLKETYEKIK